MKIVTYNINGIRAGLRKGLLEWITQVDPDVICFQEIKAHTDQVDLEPFIRLGYEIHWFPAVKKGYSGVATLSKHASKKAPRDMGIPKYDSEGRFLLLELDGVSVLNSYHPSGTNPDRQVFKLHWLEDFYEVVSSLKEDHQNLVICGDFNICHTEKDIHNPMQNWHTPGFTPEERRWMDRFLALGFHDAFRLFNGQGGHYSWWSYMARARERNLGWRIDYHMVSDRLTDQVKRAVMLPKAMHSDHCPVLLELEMPDQSSYL